MIFDSHSSSLATLVEWFACFIPCLYSAFCLDWLDIWVHLCQRLPVMNTSKTIFPSTQRSTLSTKGRRRVLSHQPLLQGSPIYAFSVQHQASSIGCLHPLSISFREIIHVRPIKIGLFPSVIHCWKPFSLTSRAWGWNIFILDRSWYFSMFLRNLSKTFFLYIKTK